MKKALALALIALFSITVYGQNTDTTQSTLPYSADFSQEDVFNSFSVIDANGDGYTWTWNTFYKTYYSYSSMNDADDYLVSPAFLFKANKRYEVTINANAYSSYYPEHFEVVMGTEPTVEALSTVIIPSTELTKTEADDYACEVRVPETGYYYIAIHAISEKEEYYIIINSLSVDIIDPKAPQAISDLKVIPGPNGQKRATLQFTTPEYAIDGSALTEELDVNIYHNDVLWKTIKAYPGVKKIVFDDGLSDFGSGHVKFSVKCSIGEHIGKEAESTVNIGYDKPLPPKPLSAQPYDDHITFTWEKVGEIGAEGGYVDPSKVSYQVWYAEDLIPCFHGYELTEPVSELLLDTNTCDVPWDCHSGYQGEYIFCIVATNEAGDSYTNALTSVYMGTPYPIPAHESFENYWTHYKWYIERDNANGFYVNIVNDGSIDDGSIEIENNIAGNTCGLLSGKFALNGAENATVTADLRSQTEGATVTLHVDVNGEMTPLETVSLTEEWTTYKWDVSAFKDEVAVRFHITYYFPEAGEIHFDNFNVLDFYSDNLAASINAPETITRGESVVVKVKVQNLGENDAADYSVVLYANDKEVDRTTDTKALKFYETAEYPLTYTPSIFEDAQDVVLKAVVEYAPEKHSEDNTSETTITLYSPQVSKVMNLSAINTPDGILVEWNVPTDTYYETTEDFENYEPFEYVMDGEMLGKWTGWDRDGGTMYGWTSGNWPHMEKKGAFGIYNPAAIGLSDYVEPSSGKQTAFFMDVIGGTGNPGNDDWMVSPRLSGMAQTISFMVSELTSLYGNEHFEVLASSTGNTPDCFEKVYEGVASTIWKEHEVELTEGTLYFAIRCTSYDAFGLLVDDITYVEDTGDPTSFNVYVDETHVASSTETCYTLHNLSTGEHKISITAVYDSIESAPESVMVTTDADATAIKNISASAADGIYTINGIRVSEARNAGVYITNGKKVIKK